MEEWVGGLWDRFITRSARRDYPQAAVQLVDIEKMAGVLFRAWGGDSGLRVAAALEVKHGARRRWLSRVGGTDDTTALAGLDHETLRLPRSIAWFPERELNRDLFLWLIALAAHDSSSKAGIGDTENHSTNYWLIRNQHATLAALKHHPGLASRQRRLLQAHLAERIAPEAMPADEAAQERAIRAALENPGSVVELPPLTRPKAKPLQPVPLWLYPAPEVAPDTAKKRRDPQQHEGSSAREEAASNKSHSAKRDDMPENESPILMMFRAESLLSWAEYVKVNRALDDDANPDAGRAAENMDQLSIAEDDSQRVASKVRLELDLPPTAVEDVRLGDGIPLPEWDYRHHELKKD